MTIGTFERSSVFSSSAVKNEGLRAYMLGVYNYMALAIGLSGLVSYLCMKTGLIASCLRSGSGSTLLMVSFLAELGIAFYIPMRLMKARIENIKFAFITYSVLNGFTCSTFLLMYTGTSVARAFFITASMFGFMSIYGYRTKKDLSSFRSLIMMALFGIIIASLVNLFLRSTAMDLLISLVGVALFTGLVAFDTQMLRNMYYQVEGNSDAKRRIAIYGAFSLYLDFVNLFIYILRFVGKRKD